MQIYLVGGAIRNRLLGLPVTERDYLVVGATREGMLQRGFKQVGQDFPVFLHPLTHEEYALARSPQNIQPKDHGLPHADPRGSLEADLSRRDLTINAIAQAADGSLVDPFGGLNDLRNRILRHVSEAFAEDPIRVLRVARFMASLQPYGFQLAPETRDLMRQMAVTGALDQLVPERVWQELSKALLVRDPVPFFTTLRTCNALSRILPELDRLWGVPQSIHSHPEKDAGQHTLLVLQLACRLSDSLAVRFAALTHDLGKGLTPKSLWPRHPDHEARGAELVVALGKRLRVPKRIINLAQHCAREHGLCHRLDELSAQAILGLLQRLDVFRRPQIFYDYLLVCEADYRGREGYQDSEYPQAERLQRYYTAARDIDGESLQCITGGGARAQALYAGRLQAVARAIADYSANR
jgi:tRNA nucleotidyltransferase (CCA-adding enzyme)